MNQSGAAAAAAATAPTEDRLGSDASAPSSGIEYLDAWRLAVKPFPGSVPPFAGFSPTEATEPVPEGDIVGTAIAAAIAAIESLGSIDATDVEPDVLAQLVEGTEQLRRMIDAATTGVAGVIDARNPLRTSHGYLNARTFLTQRAQLSGPEAYRRLQTARMRNHLGEWATAARTGTVGIAQSDAMARVAASTSIDPEVLLRDAGMLLDDAINLPYTEFERNLRMWEALAEPTP